jgi:hypothetical protein
MNMASSASPLSGTFLNAQLTSCHLQSTINEDDIISITTLMHIP